MGSAYFYHLTRSSVADALPPLIERSLERGWRVAVRCDSRDRLEALDLALWRGPPDSFLPHGLAGGEHDADQPVLLTAGTALPNDAACLMVVGDAELSPQEVSALERVCILFDGADPSAAEAARERWRNIVAAGLTAQYWSQEDGSWRKKAERRGDAPPTQAGNPPRT